MPATPIPIDAAARSLERTASILRPVPARMRLPTSTNAIVTTTSTITPNANRAMSRPPRTARSMPKSFGSGIRLAVGREDLRVAEDELLERHARPPG